MQTKIIQIKKGFAKSKGIPLVFACKSLIQTKKASYLYGHGTVESAKTGICMLCGRKLEHPVSVKYGIGPICGGHFHVPMNDEDQIPEMVKQKLRVDNWVPLSCIEEEWECEEEVVLPENHPMLKKEQESESQKGKKAIKNQNIIQIWFPYNPSDLAKVKTLEGRRFHKTPKPHWIASISVDNIEKLQEWEFEVDPELLGMTDGIKGTVEDTKEVEFDFGHLESVLMPFQKDGVKFIHAKNGRALIGDEMGLGKTVQALAYIQGRPEIKKALVIVPASLKLNWVREAKMWMTDFNLYLCSGKKNKYTEAIVKDKTPAQEICIINYDILADWAAYLKTLEFDIVVADESHKLKNNNAKRTKAGKALGRQVDKFIALSGTPIENRPIEFYNTLNMVQPMVFGDWWKYASTYCGLKRTRWGLDYQGATNTDQLHQKVTETCMLRRKKADVLKDLPPKIRSVVPLEMSNTRQYRNAEENFIAWLKKNKGTKAAKKAANAEQLAKIEGLKQLCFKGKKKAAKEWIADFIDGNGKLVIFATHTETLDYLQEQFEGICARVDGSVSGENRDKAVQEFQNNEDIRLFLGNIKAAGVGLTLTAASATCFVELDWAPSTHDQAEDRVHRIGQEASSVNAYYLVCSGTIEDEIMSLLDKKREIVENVLDGTVVKEESLFTELVKKYEKEEEEAA